MLQTGEPRLAEALAPLRRNVDTDPDPSGDVHVALAIGRQQHDASPDNLSVRRSARRRPLLEDRPALTESRTSNGERRDISQPSKPPPTT
jgi:hypothetical protein